MADIFYNDFIYESYQDYVLGGFTVDENDGVDFKTISNAVNNRLTALIEDFYMRGWAANTSTNVDYTEQDAMEQIAFIIKDNLGYFPEGVSISQLHMAIMKSEKMIKWLDETIKIRVQEYFPNQLTNNLISRMRGIPSQNSKGKVESPMLYEEAESATYETTLEEFIEELSLIEL